MGAELVIAAVDEEDDVVVSLLLDDWTTGDGPGIPSVEVVTMRV